MSTPETTTLQAWIGTQQNQGPVYLVLERDALISADLIQAIESRGPCRIMHCATASEIEPALNTVGKVEAAFLELRIDDLQDSALACALAHHGARLVLTLGEDVERVVSQGWQLLLRPFTESMVHEALS